TAPTITGDDLISCPALNVHSLVPSAGLTACSTPDESPTNTASRVTAGDDSPIELPVAADESIESPDSYFQSSFSGTVGVEVAMPVNRGLPRNCGQPSPVPGEGACASAGAAI